MPSTYNELIYAERPAPAITDKTFKLKAVPFPTSVPDNHVFVRVTSSSIDPAQRGWLTDTRSYLPPVQIGERMRAQSVAQVVESRIPGIKKGDWVLANSGWGEYALLGHKDAEKLDIPANCVPRDFLGTLGMASLTAYFGILEIGQIKPGDVVVVSGAAGATGSVAGQIAKIKGCKVIGIAGGKDKCDFLVKELGFDEAIDYKEDGWRKKLPKNIDVYFDNVGGDILEACLGRAAMFSRFVICGAISQYNAAKPKGPASFMTVISHRVTLRGFIVFDYIKKYAEARKDLAQWMSEGKLKRKEHIVRGGLEKCPSALMDMFAGKNTGKMMVEIAPEDATLGANSKL